VTRLLLAWERATAWNGVLAVTGRLLVLYLVLVVKCADVGAFFCGTLFGRHKLLPRISPGKTWEGLFGGLAAGTAGSLGFAWAAGGRLGDVPLGLTHAVVLGFLLSAAGVVGDLFESLLKRAAGAKDSGSWIPGFGGVLDVLDSVLFAAPVLFIYTQGLR
jgi:phosphatidate cytidylyltransferase